MTPISTGPSAQGPELASPQRRFASPTVETFSAPSDPVGRMQTSASTGETASKAVGFGLMAALAALVLSVGYSLTLGQGYPAAETDTPQWSAQVEPARAAFASDRRMPLRWVDHGGVARGGDSIRFTAADLDGETARLIRQAVAAQDLPGAFAAFQAAQIIPQPPGMAPVTQPPISRPVQEALSRPDTQYVKVYLYDTCYNDGDVVDLFLDDTLIAVVPLTNAGATLTLPVPASGGARVVLRGNYDGGGGITVGCRTSLGDFFNRPITVGEVQPVGLVGQ